MRATALRRRQPVELAGVDEHVVLRVGDVRQLSPPRPRGRITWRTGRSNACAKS